MPTQNVFISGVQQTTGGQVLPSSPQATGTFTVNFDMLGQVTSAAAGSYAATSLTRPVWTADAPAQVVGVLERHSVIGSTTGMLVLAVGSTPLGSGVNVLSAAVSLTATIDITQSGTVLASTTLYTMAKGDQLGWRWGTPGNAPPTGQAIVTLEYI